MKKFTTIFALAIFLFAAGATAQAESKINCTGPKEFVDSMDDLVISTILDKSTDEATKTKILAKFFRDYVNIEWIGKFVMGRNWRGLEETQQKQYLLAYEDYLIATYVPIFKDYNGEKMEFISSTPLKRENEFLVSTKIVSEGSPDINAKYRVKKKDGCFKVYDIVAEGVSMLNTQRQDFSSIYSRKGYDELMRILRSKSVAK